jgi:hypothetical protein
MTEILPIISAFLSARAPEILPIISAFLTFRLFGGAYGPYGLGQTTHAI